MSLHNEIVTDSPSQYMRFENNFLDEGSAPVTWNLIGPAPAPFVTGVEGNAWRDTSADGRYIENTSAIAAVNNSNAFTMEFVFRCPDFLTNPAQNDLFIGHGGGTHVGSPAIYINYQNNTNLLIHCGVERGGGWYGAAMINLTQTLSVTESDWIHYIMTYDGTVGRVDTYASTFTGSTSSSRTDAAGASYSPTYYWMSPRGTGSLAFEVDTMAIYPAILSSTRINAHIAAFQSSGNTAPNDPNVDGQFLLDGVTPLAEGAVTTESGFVVKGTATDPDSDNYKLQLELKEYPLPFDGTVTAESGFVASGAQASITVPSGTMLNRKKYYFQVRAQDVNGGNSGWSQLGTSNNVDLLVSQVPLITPVGDYDDVTHPKAHENIVTANVDVVVTDPNGSPSDLSLSVLSKPATFTINIGTATIVGNDARFPMTISAGLSDASASPYTVTLEATNTFSGQTAQNSFNVYVVNDAPSITSANPTKSNLMPGETAPDIVVPTATDANGHNLTWRFGTITKNGVVQPQPAWLSIDVNTGHVSIISPGPSNSDAGQWSIGLIARDGV